MTPPEPRLSGLLAGLLILSRAVAFALMGARR